MPESLLSLEQSEAMVDALNCLLNEMEELRNEVKELKVEVASLREDLATFEEQINEEGVPIDSEALLETMSMGLMMMGGGSGCSHSGGPGEEPTVFKQPFTTPRESWWPKFI